MDCFSVVQKNRHYSLFDSEGLLDHQVKFDNLYDARKHCRYLNNNHDLLCEVMGVCNEIKRDSVELVTVVKVVNLVERVRGVLYD